MASHGPEFIPPPGRRREDEREKEPPLGGPPARERLSLPEIITLIVTNIIKLTGVVIGVIGVTDNDLREDRMLVLLVAGFFIAGGEGAERFLGQLFGRPGGK
jgi:hypothetical protein